MVPRGVGDSVVCISPPSTQYNPSPKLSQHSHESLSPITPPSRKAHNSNLLRQTYTHILSTRISTVYPSTLSCNFFSTLSKSVSRRTHSCSLTPTPYIPLRVIPTPHWVNLSSLALKLQKTRPQPHPPPNHKQYPCDPSDFGHLKKTPLCTQK